MANRYESLESRLWRRVTKQPDGCWIWSGAKTLTGYGQLSVNGRLERAHRVTYSLVHGEIPAGLQVLHKCDTPSCVNPEHLFLGTIRDNSKDMVAKGRHGTKVKPYSVARGENAGQAKLTEKQVIQIRKEYLRGKDRRSNAIELANRYGVHHRTITNVVKRVVWKHI